MRGSTHLLLGALAGLPVGRLAGGGPVLGLCTAAGALGGLLPDLDHAGSLLGRYLPWPAVEAADPRTGFVRHGRRWFEGRVLWHRHETHSFGAAVLAGALGCGGGLWVGRRLGPALHETTPAFALVLGAAVLAGYLSHLAADLPPPQMLLWPLSRRLVRPRWLPAVAEDSAAGAALEWSVALAAAAYRILRP